MTRDNLCRQLGISRANLRLYLSWFVRSGKLTDENIERVKQVAEQRKNGVPLWEIEGFAPLYFIIYNAQWGLQKHFKAQRYDSILLCRGLNICSIPVLIGLSVIIFLLGDRTEGIFLRLLLAALHSIWLHIMYISVLSFCDWLLQARKGH